MRLTRTQGRLLAAIVCGIAGGFLAYGNAAATTKPRDLTQVWFAARAMLHGRNPYPLVGPGLAFDWFYPLLYPLPAAVAFIPLAPLSAPVAAGVFMGVGVGALSWALTRERWGPLVGIASTSVLFACEVAQWSPLFAAAVVVPGLSIFLVAKPSIGLATFVARPNWWAVLGALVFGGIAFVLQPTWLHDWLDAIARNNASWAPAQPYRIPLLFPGGPLALLALLRWRRPEARLVAALACVPQTPLLYETVPLLLVPRTVGQAAVLLGASHAVHYLTLWAAPLSPVPHMDMSGRLEVALLYLPCVLMVLRRPNEGVVPSWLEARVVRWPTWLRGVPA